MTPGLYNLPREEDTWNLGPDHFEDRLAVVESQAGPLLAKLHDGEDLLDSEKFDLSRFILQLYKRGAVHHAQMHMLWRQALERLRDEAHLRPLCEENGLQYSAELLQAQRDSPDDMPEFFRLALLVENLDRMAAVIAKMNWYLLSATEGFFVTGDSPVFFPGPLGLGNETSELYLPLSPNRTFMAAWRSLPERIIFTPGRQVEFVNRHVGGYSTTLIADRQDPEIFRFFEIPRR